MNILFLARRFYPDIGGVEKHVLEISKRLIAKGHTVTVISEGKSFSSKKYLGITLFKIPVGKTEKNKKYVIWKWLWEHKQIILDADVIHCHDVFYWYLPFRLYFPQKPVYTTFHGYESFPIRKNAITVRKISEKLSWGNICIGDFIKKWYGTTPTMVSYGAVEIEKKNNQKVEKKDTQSAVFIGRLDEQTGIVTYAKAVELLRKKFPKFRWIAVGDGKYKSSISKKAKTLGFQKNPERYFYKTHFAFVSRYLAILEAFAARRLVFAVYDNPVKEDYLKMAPFAPFIITAKTPEGLARKIETILYHPKIEKKIIDLAYQWVKKQSWEAMVSTYLTLWKR